MWKTIPNEAKAVAWQGSISKTFWYASSAAAHSLMTRGDQHPSPPGDQGTKHSPELTVCRAKITVCRSPIGF